MKSRRIVTGASLVPLMIPFSCYCRIVRLQGVALTSYPPSTHRTATALVAKLVKAHTSCLHPSMWLTSRALVAQPVNSLPALQCGVAGQDALGGIGS